MSETPRVIRSPHVHQVILVRAEAAFDGLERLIVPTSASDAFMEAALIALKAREAAVAALIAQAALVTKLIERTRLD